jgi:hypothetical protein
MSYISVLYETKILKIVVYIVFKTRMLLLSSHSTSDALRLTSLFAEQWTDDHTIVLMSTFYNWLRNKK